MVGFGDHGDIVEAVVGALVGKARLGPRPLEDVEDLAKAVAAFGIRHAIGFVGLRHPAAAHPKDQPAVAQLVDRGRLLRQAQRMAQRQYLDGNPDLDMAGAGRDRTRDAERCDNTDRHGSKWSSASHITSSRSRSAASTCSIASSKASLSVRPGVTETRET